MTDRDTPSRIKTAAVAMAGGSDEWAKLSPEIQQLYLEMANRAAAALQGSGALVPWDQVKLTVNLALSRHRGKLTARRADDTMVEFLAGTVVAHLKRCGYSVHAGHPSVGAGPVAVGFQRPEREGE